MNQYVTGAVIKELREKNNLTQSELAEKYESSSSPDINLSFNCILRNTC